ncbi:MAG: pentapeptide repeat-containing protein, partial [Phycisphaerales bacterium]
MHSAEIIFNDCVFTEPVRFTSCELGRVYFRNCEFQQGVSFHGTTFSDRVGFVSCEVRWPEAYEDDANLDDTIAGLDLRSCRINGNLTISTLLNEGFLDLTNLVTQGYVHVKSSLMDTRRVSSSTDATRHYVHTGPILATGAEIGGQLVISGAYVRESPAHQRAGRALSGEAVVLDEVKVKRQIFLGPLNAEGAFSMVDFECEMARLQGVYIVGVTDAAGAMDRIRNRDLGLLLPAAPGRESASLTIMNGSTDDNLRIENCLVEGHSIILANQVGGDLTIGVVANEDRSRYSLRRLQAMIANGEMASGYSSGQVRDFVGGTFHAFENRVTGAMAMQNLDVEGDVNASSNTSQRMIIEGIRVAAECNISDIQLAQDLVIHDFVSRSLAARGHRVGGTIAMRGVGVAEAIDVSGSTAQRMAMEGIRAGGGIDVSRARLDQDFSIRDAVIGQNGDWHSLNMTRANAFEANIMDVDAAGAVLLQDASLELLQVNPDGANRPRVASTVSGLKCTTLDASLADIAEARLVEIQADKIVLLRANLGTLIGLKLSRVETLSAPELLADDVQLGTGLPDSVQLQRALIANRITMLDSTQPEEGQALGITLDGARVSGPVDLRLNRSRETRISMASAVLKDRVQLDAIPQAECDEPSSRWMVEFTNGQLENDATISGATLGLVDLTDSRLQGRLRVRRGSLASIVANGIRGEGVIDLSGQEFDHFKMEGGRTGELFLPGGEAGGTIVIRRSTASLLERANPPGGNNPIDL